MHCTLHIGTEKTATTTIQRFLYLNRDRLRENGIYLPHSEQKGNHIFLSLAAYNPERVDDMTMRLPLKSKADREAYIEKNWANLQKELHSTEAQNCPTCIFSNEHLQSRLTTLKEVHSLKEKLISLGCESFQVILYIRDPVQIASSLYSTCVIAGETRQAPPPPEDPYYHNICNHRQTIERWSAVFGEESMNIRIFESGSFEGGSIISDFCKVNGWESTETWLKPERINERLSHEGVELLRRFNEKIPRFIDGSENPMRGDIVTYIRRHFAGSKYGLPRDVAEQYQQAFADDNEWVRQRYFPSRETLFPSSGYPTPSLCAIPEEELERLTNLLTDIWLGKNQTISNIVPQLTWWSSVKRVMAPLVPPYHFPRSSH